MPAVSVAHVVPPRSVARAAAPATRRRSAPLEASDLVGCTCFRARRLARRITQVYDRVLAPSGLRVTQFSLLSRLLEAGPMVVGPLAAALDMDRTTLSRNLGPLIDAGFVTLERDPVDARQRRIRATPLGVARHRAAKRLWRLAQDEINRTLGDARVRALHRLFDGVFATLDHQQRSSNAVVATPAASPRAGTRKKTT